MDNGSFSPTRPGGTLALSLMLALQLALFTADDTGCCLPCSRGYDHMHASTQKEMRRQAS